MAHIAVVSLLVNSFSARAQGAGDSLDKLLPRHYFSTLIGLDYYAKPEKRFSDTVKKLDRRLGSYGLKQTYITFYTPLLTTDRKLENNVISNSHLLLTGTYLSLRPEFAGLKDHRLVKAGVGLRYIYNSGKKGVWFADVSPFVTRDVSFRSKPYYRMASTLVYSHNVSASFNWRIGITKSFQWGNRFYLPFIGLRFGRLDKTHLSIQFPRSVSLNMVLGRRFILSLYSRPQGGMYNFSNADTLYFQRAEATFHFTRYELNSGLRAEFRIGSRVGGFVASGISSRNNITFYSDRANRRRSGYYNTYFYSRNLPPTLYLNIGVTISLGRSRSYYYNRNIYDAIDMATPEQGSSVPIPLDHKIKASDLNLRSVSDLVDYTEP